nr:ribosomal protein S9 [Chlorosarcina stigmatica]
MEILSRAVGRRKEAVAQVQIVRGTGQFMINNKSLQDYLHNNSCSIISVKSPFEVLQINEANKPSDSKPEDVSSSEINTLTKLSISLDQIDTIVKVKGGGLIGQAEAIKLGVARAICLLDNLLSNQSTSVATTNELNDGNSVRKQLKTKGYLTQDSRVKERRKYGLKKARKASQYHKR